MDSQGALGDIINSLVNNPEIMKTVSTLAKGQSTTEKADEARNKTDDAPPAAGIDIPPELLQGLPQMLSAFTSSKKTEGDDRASQRKELLYSLKPFLSEKRRELIDGILQLEGLAGVLDAFKPK